MTTSFNVTVSSDEVLRTQIPIPYTYTVFFKKGISYSSKLSHLLEVNQTYRSLVKSAGNNDPFNAVLKKAKIKGGILGNYSINSTEIDGYYGLFQDSLTKSINSSKIIDIVEPDYFLFIYDNSTDTPTIAKRALEAGSIENVEVSSSDGIEKRDKSSNKKTRIFIIDLGIDSRHEGIKGRQDLNAPLFRPDFDITKLSNYHGTAVGFSALQMAPQSLIVDVNIGIDDINVDTGLSKTTVSKVIDAVYYSIQQHENLKKKSKGYLGSVINISYGFQSHGIRDRIPLTKAIAKALELDIHVVIAAGNEGQMYSEDLLMVDQSYDGSKLDFISVGALNAQGNDIASFSNTDSVISIYAKGEDCLVPSPDGLDKYTREKGTSISAPYVAGTIANILLKLHENGYSKTVASSYMKGALLASSNTWTYTTGGAEFKVLSDYADPIYAKKFLYELLKQGYSSQF